MGTFFTVTPGKFSPLSEKNSPLSEEGKGEAILVICHVYNNQNSLN